MSRRSAIHDTFVIHRSFPFSPRTVFDAWSSAEAKSQWFVGPKGWVAQHRELEFRIGGREQLVGQHSGGKVSKFDALYYDIVLGERLVYSYEMFLEDVRISISLATIEFKPSKEGTQLVVTEQGVFLDDFKDTRGREQGTRILINQLEHALLRQSGKEP